MRMEDIIDADIYEIQYNVKSSPFRDKKFKNYEVIYLLNGKLHRDRDRDIKTKLTLPAKFTRIAYCRSYTISKSWHLNGQMHRIELDENNYILPAFIQDHFMEDTYASIYNSIYMNDPHPIRYYYVHSERIHNINKMIRI